MTAALQLSRGGAQVTVYEADERVGGLARSLELWGQTVDLGPHRFFSTEERVNRLWLDVVGRDYRFVNRLTRIYYEGHFYDYPLRPINALRNMGVVSASRCLASYLKEKAWPSYSTNANGSFESWVVDRFGRRLFEISSNPTAKSCGELRAATWTPILPRSAFASSRWARRWSAPCFHAAPRDTRRSWITLRIRCTAPARCMQKWPIAFALMAEKFDCGVLSAA